MSEPGKNPKLTPEEQRERLARLLKEKAAGPRRGPLSVGQQALWFLYKLAPESAAYHVPFVARVRSAVDVDALRRALVRVVDRHPILRTTYRATDGAPEQHVHPEASAVASFEAVDASSLSWPELTRRASAEAHEPFDLERGPAMRAHLYSRAHDDHLLLVLAHHIALDFWSLLVVVDELGALYAEEAGGPKAALKPLRSSYFDFVRREAEMLAGPEGERMLAYWRERLGDGPAPLQIPTDRPRPAMPSFQGAARPFAVDAITSERLRKVARDEGTTLNNVLLAAFFVLLHRSSGQDDVTVGMPTGGRGGADTADVAGYFVNPVALRCDLAHNPSFRDLLGRVKAAVLGGVANRDYPLPLLVEKLGLPRDPGRSPLFQAVFILQQPQRSDGAAALLLGGPGARAQLGGLALESVDLEQHVAQFDLELMLIAHEGALAGTLQYDTALFDAPTVDALCARFANLLGGVAEDPARPIGELPFLEAAERRALLVEYNDTAVDFGPARASLLHQGFEASADRAPEALAVVGADGRLGYGELERRANRLAHHLRAQGVGRGSLVGVCVERSTAMVVAVLAVLKAGGAYVPLDPAYPQDRLAHILTHAGAATVVTEARALHRVRAEGVTAICLDRDAEAIAARPSARPDAVATPGDLAYVIYTSGSTGTPKGVAIEHASAVNTLLDINQRFGVGERDRVLALSSLSFDLSVYDLFGLLAAGGAVVLPNPEDAREPRHWLELAVRERVTFWDTVPALMEMFIGYARTRPEANLSALRLVLMSGDWIPLSLPTDIHARLPGATIYSGGGATEASIWSILFPVERVDPVWESVPYGRPMANQRFYVLDEAFEPAPIGVPGALYIGGVGLAREYWRDPERTRVSFVTHPRTGERLYRTGDLGRHRRGGVIEFLGRKDSQVKIRGYRIELGEIESVLAKHPGLEAAVVTAHAPPAGPAARPDKRLVAYYVPRSPAPAEHELVAWLRAKLPEYMVPAAYVALERLPLSANGKVDRGKLPAPFVGGDARAAHAPPASELEKSIAAIWAEVLGAPSVGLDDNFFDLGGHSLLMARVQNRVREALGREVRIVSLFQHPTVRALAKFLALPADGADGADGADAAALAPYAERRRARLGQRVPVAIIGMAGRFPGAGSVDELWANLRAGKEGITFFSDDELVAAGVSPALLARPDYVKAAGVIEGADAFDAAYFGYTPRDAQGLDPQQALLLETAVEALEHGGYFGDGYEGRVGVFAGGGMTTYLLGALSGAPQAVAGYDPFELMIGHDKDFATTRVSYKLNLRGPSYDVQTACSTSLVAVHLACQSLQSGECDLALAGGVSLTFPEKEGYLYREGAILSPDGHCRPFDAEARGTVGGSGVAMVLLKPLDAAIADGDTIYAVIKGSAVNNDGSGKVTYTAPSVDAQAEVIAEAQAVAGVRPDEIGYVEAHGTATPMGDPIEIAALTKAFGAPKGKANYCAVGSLKSNLGHLNTAAGVAGLIKAALCVAEGEIPPTLHFKAPNPQLDLAASPFKVAAELTPWREPGRKAGVSSFGIGGTNVHVVLEEAPPAEAAPSARPAQLLVLSAKSADALEAATARLSAHLAKHPDACLADVAYTLQVGRKALPHRRALVARDARDAAKALGARDPSRLLAQTAEAARPVAFLFSGQGSQHPGMGRGLYEHEPTFRAWVDRGAAGLPFDLLGVLYGTGSTGGAGGAGGTGGTGGTGSSGDAGDAAERASRLRRTALAQPALFVIEYALAQLWLERGLQPVAMLGHSVGEYVAATLAGVMSYDEALALVAARGRIVDALPPGSMLGVALPEGELTPLLGPSLSLAAVNGPSACVVSGPSVAIDTLTAALAARGVASRRLQTSHAFHSAMMDGGLDAFRAELKKVRLAPPQTPFVSNVTGAWVRPEEATNPEYWVRHLRGTVRFGQGLETLRASGDPVLIEVGPGTALTTLARSGAPKGAAPAIASMRHPDQDTADAEVFLGAVGRAWLAGVAPSWAGLHGGEKRRRVPLPTYPFQRKTIWPKLRGGMARGAERPTASAGQRIDDVGAWFYAPAWRHAPDPPALDPAKAPKRWLVLADRAGLGERVAARLRELEGAEVRVVGAGEAPTTRAGHEALVKEAAPEHVVDLRGVDPSRDDTSAFYDLLFLGQALASLESLEPAARLTVVASGSQRLFDEPLDPGKAAAMAAATVLGQELPQLTCRHVDVPAALRSIDLLVAELFAADATTRVALRGKRWVESLEPRPIAAGAKAATRLRRGGVYLITGGLGRVGLTLCEALARGYGARLVVTGRSPLAAGDARIARLEALGAEVAYVAGDVADPAAAAAAVRAAIERFGALHGVVHAAGVPSTDLTLSTLAELTPEACEAQFHAKARGARALAAALAGHAPDFVVAMSSLATVLGGLGFTAYAAANAYLDAFARAEGGPWLSIGWDAWREEEAGAGAASFGAELARLAIAPAEGVEAFERLLGAPPADAVLVSTADLGARVAKWVHRVGAEAPRAVAAGTTAARPELTTPYVAPSGEVEVAIAQIWRELLGFDQIGVHDDFMELGGHSLIATQVVSRVRKTFQIEVPMRAFLEAPTVAQFTDVVLRARAAEAAPDQLDDLLARLEGLSEAEAAELLSA